MTEFYSEIMRSERFRALLLVGVSSAFVLAAIINVAFHLDFFATFRAEEILPWIAGLAGILIGRGALIYVVLGHG